MSFDDMPVPHARKRKRRRQDKSAIAARLVLDEHVKGDVGILSEDLFADLFPASAQVHVNGNDAAEFPDTHYVAICPWGPSNSVEDSTWNLVPVRPSSALAHSTLQFSPASSALQSFAESLQKTAPSKLMSNSRKGIEIHVLDAVPLPLESVFVTIEGDVAKRLENGEGTFHGEHARTSGKGKGKAVAVVPEDLLTSAVREALAALSVVHTADVFSLPLAPHPVTHAAPPPARVTLCEPVGQGILLPKTKIIITQTSHRGKGSRKHTPLPLDRSLDQVNEEEEDTSNDQFYSAAEDRYRTDSFAEDDGTATETETEASSADDSLSDDSMDDIISLRAPMLPSHNGGTSTLQPGTPLTLGGRAPNSIGTPGSVYSSFTATTARASGQRGRLFKTQGLARPLHPEILHPKPSSDDDEEARVYVDIKSLSKIGCFSGDWVRLETAAEPPANGAGLWSLGSFAEIEQESLWRPVKVYGLPETYGRGPVAKMPSSNVEGKRLSFFESQVKKPSSPAAYLSPILLANLESTTHCRISPLRRAPQSMKIPLPKLTSSSRPPFARELKLQKISTPFSSDRTLQNALFAGLKRYFAGRTRVVRKGDLIGIPIDEALGRTLYQPAGEDIESDELLASSLDDGFRPTRATGVAWFKIGYVGLAKENVEISDDDEDVWGGAASIDPTATRMMQSGSEGGRIPSSENPWEYYLGLKSVRSEESTAIPELRKPHVTTLQRRLRELIAAATSPRAIHLKLQPLAILLISTQRNIGKATLASRACADIGLHTFSIDAYDILSEGGAGSDVKTAGFLESRSERAISCGPEFCTLLIRHIEALTADRMVTTLKDIAANVRVLIATTTEVDKIPDGVRGIFTHELEMSAPDEWEREGILRGIIEGQPIALAPEVDLGGVAVKTAALVAGDLVDVVDRAIVARNARIEALALSSSSVDSAITVRDVLLAGGQSGSCLTKVDFELAVEAARKNFADAIGAPKIPNVGWDDVGGLSNVKDAVMETIQLPLERPELFAKGMKKRSGILFYGPPGTGKTLLAKAIATEFSLNFFSVKGPELLNMYIGESEANVRRVFQRARDARPCVVFFDELDSVAPKRGNQGDSGGVMDRIVSQLLAELDGMSDGEDGGGGVFVIGATNRPDLLDAALLRPGRFDKMLYLGVSDTHEKQLTIMEALTRKFTLHPTLSLARVAAKLPFTYTGADFYALCSDAMLKAVTRQASLVDAKLALLNAQLEEEGKKTVSTAYWFDHFAKEEDVAVMVMEEDFLGAERELVPSVSWGELEHYKRVRAQFEGKPDKQLNGTGMVREDQVDVKGKGRQFAPESPSLEVMRPTSSSSMIRPLSSSGRPRRTSVSNMPRPDSSRSNGSTGIKGKGKAMLERLGGKGKSKARDEDEGHGDDRKHSWISVKGKGKAKEKLEFEEGTVEDEEELY